MEEILPKEKAGSCVACSDFPTSHTTAYITRTLESWGNDRVQYVVRIPAFARLLEYIRRAGILWAGHIMHFAYVCARGKTFTDPARAASNRSYVIWQEAIRRGIAMEQIVLFGMVTDCYRARVGNRWIYFQSLPIPADLEARSYEWIDDKFLFKRLLQDNRIPTASAILVASRRDVRKSFTILKMPLVAKPRIGSRARHTMTNIQTLEQLEHAFASAQQLCRYVLIEEHIPGELCRATVVQGVLKGFLKKSQPRVTGDGIQTIRELVGERNARKPERVWDILLGEEHAAYLERQGYTLDSVLEVGKVLDISRHSGRQVGGRTREMPMEVHPKLREYVERAARLLRAPIIGFDLIIPDPELDPDSQKWGILEANTLPFIDLHYNPLYGETSNVAGAVWDLWNEKDPASAESYTTSLTSFSKIPG